MESMNKIKQGIPRLKELQMIIKNSEMIELLST